MAVAAAPWLLITLILSTFCTVGCALACWIAVSRCTRSAKQLRQLLQTPTSAARLETLAAEQAEFVSSLQKLSTTVKRLSSRYGMEELRERRENEPPPVGTPKAQLRLWYKQHGPAEARRLMPTVLGEENSNAS